jgi:DNA-directed RNA polymerase specialized sigma24 family protein
MDSATTPAALLIPHEPELSDTCHLQQLSVEALVQLSKRAYNQYRLTGYSDERFAFELFRRAVEQRNERSWQALVEIYTPLVATWIQQLEKGRWLIEQQWEIVPALVNTCFLKFFLAMQPAVKFIRFPSLAALLQYLHCCARTVVYDECQSLQRRYGYEEKGYATGAWLMSEDPAIAIEASHVTQSLWKLVLANLNSSQERVILFSIYLWGMSPREISTAYPNIFPTPDAVYRVKQNMLDRLRQERQLHAQVRSTLAS